MILVEKKVNKWVQKAEKKGIEHGVFPKDFFANKKSAEGYATGLVKYSDGNVGKAIKRLNFYLNRSKDAPNRGVLKSALKILEKRLEKQKTKKEGVEYMNAEKYLAEKFESLEGKEVVKENISQDDLDEHAFERVASQVEEGYKEGELNYEDNNGNSVRGWWKIKIEEDDNDEDIRLQEIARIIRTGVKHGYEPTFDVTIEWFTKDIEEKKLTPKEIEDAKEDEDSEEVEKIERPKGSLRKSEVHEESVQYNERFLTNADRWMSEEF